MNAEDLDLVELEGVVAMAIAPVGMSSYDFEYRSYFVCRSLIYGTDRPVIGRFGAIDDYESVFSSLAAVGIRLVNDVPQHVRAASICGWEPVLRGLTPETLVSDNLPAVEEISQRFGWPVFIKGDRQTSLHRGDLSIARGPEDYARIRAAWATDRILNWQKAAIRRFVPLRRVGDTPGGIQASFEFRVFCWHGTVVGYGPYWASHAYQATRVDGEAICALASRAAQLVDVPFLVVDIAQTAEGEWIVIECNDGQESSYGGNVPLSLWQRLIDAERARLSPPS